MTFKNRNNKSLIMEKLKIKKKHLFEVTFSWEDSTITKR